MILAHNYFFVWTVLQIKKLLFLISNVGLLSQRQRLKATEKGLSKKLKRLKPNNAVITGTKIIYFKR